MSKNTPLPPMTPQQRKEYETLRRYGANRDDALKAILKAA
jgi:hypothetical protein